MIKEPKWITRNTVVGLVLLSISQVHAEDPAITSDVHDGNDVIEEIVVVGGSKKPRFRFDRSLNTGSAFPKPKRLELLPAYDPQRADLNLDLLQQDESAARVGIVTLFRLSFGR